MLYRVLTFSTGETQALPLGAYGDPGDATRAKNDRQRALGEILSTGRVVVGAGVNLQELSLAELMEDIGIDAVGHTVTEVEVQGPEVLAGAGAIILPPGAVP
jgi:hypothetical protein